MRYLAVLFMVCALVFANVAASAAQEMDVSFSDVKLRELGFPEIEITVGVDGVEAPSELEAGYYLVTLRPTEEFSVYLDFMQAPPGLDPDEARDLALQAASNDLAQPGWKYAGGTNTFEIGVPVSFAIYLAPGEYMIAASYYAMEEGAEETMFLEPLVVTGEATPVGGAESSPVASSPVADVTLEMTDELQYVVTPGEIPAGPQLWEITNTGVHHAHHVVMNRIPDGVTAEDIVADFESLFSGTPPAGEPLVAQFTYVGYATLQSGGFTTWNEFDLDPGTYAVICFIIDPESGVPHVLSGMVTTFTVT